MTYQAVMPRDIESVRLAGRWQMRPDAALCAMAVLGSVSIGACLMRAPAWLSASTRTLPSAMATAVASVKHAPAIVAKASAPKGTVLATLQPLRRIAKVAPPTRVAAIVPGKEEPAAAGSPHAPAFSAMPMSVSVAAASPLPAVAGQAAPVALAPIVSVQTAPITQPIPAIVAEAAPLRSSLEPETPVADAVEPDVAVSLPATSALEHEIPLPVRRPTRLAMLEAAPPSTAAMPPRVAATREAVPQTAVPQAAAPAAPPAGVGHADGNSFFDKLFKQQPQQPAGPALAYAAPESQSGGLFSWLTGPKPAAVSPDRLTAIYDISAHTVTLPDGTQLEAHSGYGEAKDDIASVSVRMRGVTPPNMYDLKPREALFHGVRALRMTPVGAGATYGRAGLLTHSYMLRGREGESNGCVVFRDYEAFLRAYDSGQIRRLLVVSRAS